jgi:hypothetical protein
MNYIVKVPFKIRANSEHHARVIASIYLKRKGVPPHYEEVDKRGKKIKVKNDFGYEPFEVEIEGY